MFSNPLFKENIRLIAGTVLGLLALSVLIAVVGVNDAGSRTVIQYRVSVPE